MRSTMSSVGAEEVVAAALVHQRVGPEFGRHVGAARAPHQLDVVHVGRAVGPLKGARQRRHARLRVERERVARAAVVERVVEFEQLRREEGPVVERALQRGDDRVRDAAVLRSRETTTSWPSRVPSFSVASFIGWVGFGDVG